jgi:hypothetical protein
MAWPRFANREGRRWLRSEPDRLPLRRVLRMVSNTKTRPTKHPALLHSAWIKGICETRLHSRRCAPPRVLVASTTSFGVREDRVLRFVSGVET